MALNLLSMLFPRPNAEIFKTSDYNLNVDERKSKYKDYDQILCEECNLPHIDYQWCQQCNSKRFQQDFLKWTSKYEFIDKFIQEVQLSAKSSYEVLEWIPYDKLKDINYYTGGGFSKIGRAIWLDGPINSWNFNKQQWKRWTSIPFATERKRS